MLWGRVLRAEGDHGCTGGRRTRSGAAEPFEELRQREIGAGLRE